MIVRSTIWILFLIVVASLFLDACRKNDSHRTTPLHFTVPAGFPPPQYNFNNEPLTEEAFHLGRKLFYDPGLSKDGTISCASCHHQIAGFGTFDHDLSHGINNQHTLRNAPSLANLAWLKEYRWDGSATTLDEVIIRHITASNEMGETVNGVISKLQSNPGYKKLFSDAYGTDAINSQRLSGSLKQFVLSLVSGDAKYDRVKSGKETFSVAEQTGYGLFVSKCATCHIEPLFTDLSYRNNGLGFNMVTGDIGRMNVTGMVQDSLKFRVTSLRNVAITFPFGHDGRVPTISQFLHHYSTGIQDGSTLDPLLKNKIPLTTEEHFYLQQFLFTLTDTVFLNNKRFGPL